MKIIELYRFVQGSTIWTFTSSDASVIYNSETYIPIPIGRSGIEIKEELSKANIDIKMAIDNVTAREWLKGSDEIKIGLTLFQKTPLSVDVIWKGRMAGRKPGRSDVSFTFESIFTSLRRPGLRARYQRPCRHALYGPRCKVLKADFAETLTVTASVGNTLTVTGLGAFLDGYFLTGMIEAPDGMMRMIVEQTSTTVKIQRPIDSLNIAVDLAPTDVVFYPGCNRTREHCKNKFSNLLNFGGFPFIPIRNPMDGSSII